MAVKDVIRPIPMTSFNTGGITGNYQPINAAGLPYPCVSIKILNYSDFDINVSYDDGLTHEYIAAGASAEFNFQTNSRPHNYVAMMKKGTIIYVKYAGGGQKGGYVYLVGWYLS